MQSTKKTRLFFREDGYIGVAFLVIVIAILVYLLIFWLYASTIIARPYETEFNSFWPAIAHGLFVFPSLIVSLFDPQNFAIYQTPNNGGWYDVGYYIGLVLALGGSGSAVSRRRS